MKIVFMNCVIGLMMVVGANASSIKYNDLNSSDIVAMQRGWNEDVSKCFVNYINNFKTTSNETKKNITIIENEDKGFIEFNIKTEIPQRMRCALDGIYDKVGNHPWEFISYEELEEIEKSGY